LQRHQKAGRTGKCSSLHLRQLEYNSNGISDTQSGSSVPSRPRSGETGGFTCRQPRARAGDGPQGPRDALPGGWDPPAATWA